MIIIEYRVPMPFAANEYRIAQLYTIAKKSRIDSLDLKNGVRINANEPYDQGPNNKGQYTNKTYYLASRLPDWLKRLMPSAALKLKEEAWNAYPYTKSRFSSPLFEKLGLEIESRYVDGPPTEANVFNLNQKEQQQRSIVMLDIANDNYRGRRIEESEAHRRELLQFEPLYRARLTKEWLRESELEADKKRSATNSLISHFMSRDLADPPATESSSGASSLSAAASSELQATADEPINEPRSEGHNLMTCYKLCRVKFPVWPFQEKVEQFIQHYCYDTIMESHRQAWLWQDEWTGMDMAAVRVMERDTERHLRDLMRRDSSAEC